MMPGVLDGIRILDFGRYIAGPFCAALLADIGAEVIRIERIGGGEDRAFIPVGAGPEGGGAMFLAMSGAVYLSGMPGQPIASKVPWVDFGTACLSAFGTLAALYERGKSGSGQKVEGALLRTAIAFANSVLIEQSLTGVDRTAIRNRGFNSAPGDIFRTRDGWIIATVIGQPMFRRWCRMIGEEHWLSDPRFADDQARADHGEIISARMSAWCGAKTCAEA